MSKESKYTYSTIDVIRRGICDATNGDEEYCSEHRCEGCLLSSTTSSVSAQKLLNFMNKYDISLTNIEK